MDTAIVTAVVIAAATFILQKTLGNIISGIVLMITRPFKVGDKIVVRSISSELVSGKVVSISLLYVKVQIYNRDVTIISTSQLDNFIVINKDYKEGANHTEMLRLSLDSDHRKAVDIIRRTLVENENTQNTADNTDVICKYENGAIVIRYNVRTANVDESFKICSDICEDLIDILKKEDDITVI